MFTSNSVLQVLMIEKNIKILAPNLYEVYPYEIPSGTLTATEAENLALSINKMFVAVKEPRKELCREAREYEDYYQRQYIELISNCLNNVIKNICIKQKGIHMMTTTNCLKSVLMFVNKSQLVYCKQLHEITSIDRENEYFRFALIYTLYSQKTNIYINLGLQLADRQSTTTVVEMYDSANWLEREVWDLYGIFVSKHPGLRRILTDYGFAGNPLRKDFPPTGYVEIYYNDSRKLISYEPVELAQESRARC